MPRSERGVRLDMAYARKRPRGDRRRQGAGEDESRRMASDEIDECGRCRDIPPDEPERLRQRTLDNRQAVRQALTLGDSPAARPIEPYRMDLVEIGNGAMTLCDVAQLGNGRDIAIHGIDRFEAPELRTLGICGRQQALKIARVVVAEAMLFGDAVPNALDHRNVVEGVRKYNAVRDMASQRSERRLVGDLARCKEQGGLLPVEIRKFPLEQYVIVVRTRDVARSSGAGAGAIDRFMHRG
jgi:hypothetical protein